VSLAYSYFSFLFCGSSGIHGRARGRLVAPGNTLAGTLVRQPVGRVAAGYSGLALVSWVAAFGLPGPVLGRLAGRARALAAPAGSR
jgi:hypothetical protein